MADIDAARAEIQWVVKLLVGRFGREEDVFKHLSQALEHLRELPPMREVSPPLVAAEAGEESEPGSSEEELAPAAVDVSEVEEVIPPPPLKPSRYERPRRRR